MQNRNETHPSNRFGKSVRSLFFFSFVFAVWLFIVRTTCAIKFEHHFNCYIVHYLFYYYFSCSIFLLSFILSQRIRAHFDSSGFVVRFAFRSLCNVESNERQNRMQQKKRTCAVHTKSLHTLTSELRGASTKKRVQWKRRR